MDDEKGHFRAYVDKRFTAPVMEIIRQANIIIHEYEQQGYSLTLRQLYYQFVARDIIPNQQAEYKKLGDVISNGRLAGLISWTAIEDRTRNLMGLANYNGPAAAVRSARADYRVDLWATQSWRPEVWVEKEALAGVVGAICNKLRVNFFAVRGYNSQSEQWNAGRRFADYVKKGQRPIVFHLGDHDPSGIDMTRDNRDRLEMFAGTPIIVQRLALNMNQIEELNPPPNPAKATDSRFEDYREKFGDSSWELDALDPRYITNLIKNAVGCIQDAELWDEALEQEVADKRNLDDIIEGLTGQS